MVWWLLMAFTCNNATKTSLTHFSHHVGLFRSAERTHRDRLLMLRSIFYWEVRISESQVRNVKWKIGNVCPVPEQYNTRKGRFTPVVVNSNSLFWKCCEMVYGVHIGFPTCPRGTRIGQVWRRSNPIFEASGMPHYFYTITDMQSALTESSVLGLIHPWLCDGVQCLVMQKQSVM